MFLQLPDIWVVLLNVLGIPLAHLGCSWTFTRLPARWFDPAGRLFRIQPWERKGRIYDSFLRVKRWKRLLPDAAPWFGGFAKRTLRGAEPAYLHAFRLETCRSEAAHYAQIIAISLFLIWTPWPAAAVLPAYALLSNLPCIILQRHNRLRLTRIYPHALRHSAARRTLAFNPAGSFFS